MTHLLVTNDFPPKVDGIQSYLWELWRRLPPDDFAVLTTPYEGAEQFDRQQPFRIVRTKERMLLPSPKLIRAIDKLAADIGAGLVVLDPALPLGLAGSRLDLPYAVLVHGAEITVPARVPGVRHLLASVLRGARLVVANSDYPAEQACAIAGTALATVTIYPGIDGERFRPFAPEEREQARLRLGLPSEACVVLGLSRLVRRKGFDVLIEAAARLAPGRPELLVAIGGSGRDRGRLERVARRSGAPVRFLGRLPEADLPAAFAAADVFAMLCRNRWAGVEQEGLGIVFLEAAAGGVPQVAGASGGAAEAVLDGRTGLVVAHPGDVEAAAAALARLVDDPGLRSRYGEAGRARVLTEFDRDRLAARLGAALDAAA
jgi:phosphatidylinositol alpha-1,6-mannosyltransferase